MIKFSCPGCGRQISYDKKLIEESEIITHPTISGILEKDREEYSYWLAMKQKEICQICGIEYNKEQYAECPLCLAKTEKIQADKKIMDLEASLKSKGKFAQNNWDDKRIVLFSLSLRLGLISNAILHTSFNTKYIARCM